MPLQISALALAAATALVAQVQARAVAAAAVQVARAVALAIVVTALAAVVAAVRMLLFLCVQAGPYFLSQKVSPQGMPMLLKVLQIRCPIKPAARQHLSLLNPL